jgi:sulfotransferase
MKKLYFLSGPPRTGSKLFASILNQNPLFHSEETSPLCSVLWNLHQFFNLESTQTEFFAANRNKKEFNKIFSSVIKEYYRDVSALYIFDKQPAWTLHGNYEMILKYIDNNPKIIVTMRNIKDIVKSYVNVLLKNNFSQSDAENILLNFDKKQKSPILRPIAGVIWVQFTKNVNYHIVDYDNLVNDPNKEIFKVYNFLDLKMYSHDYNNIVFSHPENKKIIYDGLMEVRSKINKKELDICLSKKCLKEIEKISDLIIKSSQSNILQNDIKKIEDFYQENIDH